MAYTPPAVTEINFSLTTGYTPPAIDAVDFDLSPVAVFSVKSLVVDVADNWRAAVAMMCRQLDLIRSGIKIQVFNGVGATTYGPEVAPDYTVDNLFDVRTSKVGTPLGQGWQTNDGDTNQRVIIVFDSIIEVDSIIVVNHHDSGTQTNYGINNTKITVTESTYTDTTYGAAVTGGVLIFDDSVPQHSAVDEADEQLLLGPGLGETVYLPCPEMVFNNQFSGGAFGGVIVPVEPIIFGTSVATNYITDGTFSVKSLVVDIANNWGGAFAMACRQLDLIRTGAILPILDTLGATTYGPEVPGDYDVDNLFDVTTSKVGAPLGQGWQTNDGAAGMRVILVLDDIATIDSLVAINQHNSGTDTEYGIRLTKIQITEAVYTDTTYGATVPDSVVVFDGQVEEHSAVNEEDPQTLFGPGIDPNTYLQCPEMVINQGVSLAEAVVFGGITLICPPLDFSVTPGITAAGGGVIIPAPELEFNAGVDTSGVIAGAWVEVPEMVINQEVETAGVFFTGTLSIAVPELIINQEVSGEPVLSGGIVVQCPAIIIGVDPDAGAVFIFEGAQAITKYFLTITGAADGVEDIDIPIVSFQSRRRSGADTYLQVVIPSVDFIDYIIARSNGTMRIDQAFIQGDTVLQREPIIETAIDQVNPYQGGTNESLVLIGYKTTSYTSKAVTLTSPVYRAQVDGRLSYRLPTPEIFLNPGDVVTVGDDTFTLGVMSYAISDTIQQIDLTEA